MAEDIVHIPKIDRQIAISRGIRDTSFTFGVSGILRNSALVLYDRNTFSLWTQKGVAIAGPLKGIRLKDIPSERTTWEKWKMKYLHSLVMVKPPRSTGRPKIPSRKRFR